MDVALHVVPAAAMDVVAAGLAVGVALMDHDDPGGVANRLGVSGTGDGEQCSGEKEDGDGPGGCVLGFHFELLQEWVDRLITLWWPVSRRHRTAREGRSKGSE